MRAYSPLSVALHEAAIMAVQKRAYGRMVWVIVAADGKYHSTLNCDVRGRVVAQVGDIGTKIIVERWH